MVPSDAHYFALNPCWIAWSTATQLWIRQTLDGVAARDALVPRDQREFSALQELSLDIQVLRGEARAKIEEGAITDAYGGGRERVVEVLNTVLATEQVCVLRYKRHYFMASGMRLQPVAAVFLERAMQEQDHADRVAVRIVQVQGKPDLNPDTSTARSQADYVEGTDLPDMVQGDLIAERIAIASYQAIARWLGDEDPTSHRLVESLLEVEEEHAEDLSSLLAGL